MENLTTSWQKSGAFVETFPSLAEDELQMYNIRRAWERASSPLAVGSDGMAALASREIGAALGSTPRQNEILYPAQVIARTLDTIGTAELVNGTRVLTVDALRPASVVGRAGAQFVGGLDGRLKVAVLDDASTGYWVDEGSAPPAVTPTVEGLDVDPTTLAATGSYSEQLFVQTFNRFSVRADDLLLRDQLHAILAELDRVALVGTGIGLEPRGIAYTDGVTVEAGGTNGAPPTEGHLWNMLQAVLESGVTLERACWVFSPKVARKLGVTPVGSDRPIFDMNEGRLLGAKVFITSNMPDTLTKGDSGPNCSAIICGGFEHLMVALWGVVRSVLDPYTLGRSGIVRCTTMIAPGFAVRQPQAFSVMLDALAT